MVDEDGDEMAITDSYQLRNHTARIPSGEKLKLTIVPASNPQQQSTEQMADSENKANQTDFSVSIQDMMKHLELGLNNLQATVEKSAVSSVNSVVKTAAETAVHVFQSLLPQASLSEKPQFDVICDGCYSPIRG